MLSNTVKNIVPSGTVSINARVLEMMDEGTEIINLSVGEPDFNTPEPAKKGAAWAMEHNIKVEKVGKEYFRPYLRFLHCRTGRDTIRFRDWWN